MTPPAPANAEPILLVHGIQAVELSDGSHRIILARDEQPKPQRPTIDQLTTKAKAKNANLAQILEEYARDLAAKNPSEVADQPDGPAYYPPVKIDGIPLEELIDLGKVAEGQGIPHAEAIDRYAWQTNLQAVHNKLENAFPDEAAGTSMLNEGRTARIGFKGQIPKLAIELAKTLPAEVELIGNKGFSKKKLREVLETSSTELGKRPEVAGYVGKYDIDTGVIRFEVKPQKEIDTSEKRSALQETLRLQPPTNTKIRIKIDIKDDINLRPLPPRREDIKSLEDRKKSQIAADDPYLRGGGIISSGDTGTVSICTSAFNLPRSDGYRSTTSARHCWSTSNDQYWFYWNHPSYTGNRTTLGFTQNPSQNYDFSRLIQTGSVDLTFTRTFYAALNRPRYVNANGTSPLDGARVCFFGRTSHTQDGEYTCGAIEESDVTYRMRGISGDWFGGIVVSLDGNVNLLGGDSGGPLWYGKTAWGVSSMAGADGNAYFVATDRINDSNGLGTNWNVWTCPTC
ncbi:hypothetical protein [Nonomuraea sp. B1E8]|uniref:hypothetical protein n=1 Tax=unclassified Nonomuraea TaxID=2593643 RepID=UPI00325D5E90